MLLRPEAVALLAFLLLLLLLPHSVAFQSIHITKKGSPVNKGTCMKSIGDDYEDYDDDGEAFKDFFVSRQLYFDGEKPEAGFRLATLNFVRQGTTIFSQLLETLRLKEKDPYELPDCLGLTLSNEDVKDAEYKRENSGGKVDAHPVSRTLYDVGCLLLDNLFDERPIQRFWFLEIIARIPYFSYVSMLHLYESLGWWRACELRRVHNAEEWNELHHLLIMESLGGNKLWSDRFLGYHVAILYYWSLVTVYFFSPRIAYQFMELLEAHAVDTYSTFVKENQSALQKLPPPPIARSYYKTGDLYFFDDFQQRTPGSRRPLCETLYDVFKNISEDEAEHVKTMKACQDYAKIGVKVQSPHVAREDKELEDVAGKETRRRMWKEWSAEVNLRGDRKVDGQRN